MGSIKVCKFSGNVLLNSSDIQQLKKIIISDNKRKIVVVGAPGKTDKKESTAKDLARLADYFLKTKKINQELFENLRQRYTNIFKPLKVSSASLDNCFDNLRERVQRKEKNRGKYFDKLKCAGEEYSARLTAEYLKMEGLNCQYVDPKDAGLLVTPVFGNADLLKESYKELSNSLSNDMVNIIPGFFGYTKKNEIAMLSKGGSDLTGTILSNALDAELYENFFGYDGLNVCDPALQKHNQLIREMTYQELREMTYGGMRPFNEFFLAPLIEKEIPMKLVNFHDPSKPGTLIVGKRKGQNLVGIASEKGFCTITIEKYMMNKEIGIGRRLLKIIEDNNLSYEHLPSGVDTMTVILKQDQLPLEKIRALCNQIYSVLRADNVYFDYNRALISIVGQGLKKNINAISDVFLAFRKAAVNVEMINKGGSEISIIFSVVDADMKKAISSLFNQLFR